MSNMLMYYDGYIAYGLDVSKILTFKFYKAEQKLEVYHDGTSKTVFQRDTATGMFKLLLKHYNMSLPADE